MYSNWIHLLRFNKSIQFHKTHNKFRTKRYHSSLLSVSKRFYLSRRQCIAPSLQQCLSVIIKARIISPLWCPAPATWLPNQYRMWTTADWGCSSDWLTDCPQISPDPLFISAENITRITNQYLSVLPDLLKPWVRTQHERRVPRRWWAPTRCEWQPFFFLMLLDLSL